MTQIAIRTEKLTRHFGSICALDQLSIEIPNGIIFGFLGPNGSGKTTTIRLLLGLLEPTSGSAAVLGLDLGQHSDQVRANCGALLEHNGLYERLTAEDNLDFFAKIWCIPTQERQPRIRELLSNLGLWERRQEIVGNWSRGMKQKLAMARVLLHRPTLIFLDEPTAGLDPISAAALREDLARLAQQENVTVFLTTHNLTEAEKLCHQVGVIRAGKLVALGSPKELTNRNVLQNLEIHGRGFSEEIINKVRQHPGVVDLKWSADHLEIKVQPLVQAAPIISLLVVNGVEIEEVRKDHPSLEEVFLKLMEEDR